MLSFRSALTSCMLVTFMLGSFVPDTAAQFSVLSELQGYVSIGTTAPQSPRSFNELNGTGVNVRAGVGLPIGARWSAILSGSYHTLPSEEASGPFFNSITGQSGTVTAEGGYAMVTAMGELKYTLFATDVAHLYFIGGGGAYREEASFKARFNFDDPIQPDETERSTFTTTGMLASVGGGFTLMFTEAIGAFVEPRYGLLFYSPEMERYVTVRGGIAFRP